MDILQAERWAVAKMAQHGLTDWTFDFDGHTRRLGLCLYKEKRISVSLKYTSLNPEKVFMETVLHEIAHALSGYDAGHGPKWKAKCLEIGALPYRLASPEGLILPNKKYISICGGCGFKHHRDRKPKKDQSCGMCSKKFNSNLLLIWTLNECYRK